MSNTARAVTSFVVVWIVAGIAAAYGILTLPGPADWFVEWTNLFVRVGVAGVGSRALWVTPTYVKEYLATKNRQH